MQGRDERTLGELFSELAQETSTLVRQEVNLAKTEMSQKASRVGKDVGFLAAGGAVAYAGLLAILAGVIVLLGQVIPMWLSALLVGLVVAAVGYFLVIEGPRCPQEGGRGAPADDGDAKGGWTMDQRPDAVGRDPLGGTPGFDPATDAFEPDAVRDPALGGTDVDPVAGDPVEVDDVEATRVEIQRTRADMSETVDAIQERLSPQNLKEQAKDRVKEATVGRAREARSGVVETVRANPLPAALTGIGLGWLLMSARGQGSAQSRYRDDAYRYRTPTNEYAREVDEYPVAPKYLPREGSHGVSAGETLGRARDKVGETATQAQDKAGDVSSRVQSRASQLGSQARHQASRAGGGLQRMLNENPLTMGALAIGTGAAIGLAIPKTSKEHEVMGEARDTVVEKAQEVQQSVQRVAEEAQGAAQQEAENQGLK